MNLLFSVFKGVSLFSHFLYKVLKCRKCKLKGQIFRKCENVNTNEYAWGVKYI